MGMSMMAMKYYMKDIPQPANKRRSLVAAEQPKSAPAQASANFDASVQNEKKPPPDLGVKQRIATTGETVPIVFGKRVSSMGGVWVSPSLLKSGSTQFKGQFLYAISVGDIASSPVKISTFAGLRNLNFIDDQTITLAHNYSVNANLSSGTCPIAGSGLYCGIDTISYLAPTHTPAAYTDRWTDLSTYFTGQRVITRGEGDTSNSGFTYTNSNVYDAETGADISAAWFNWSGTTSNTVYYANYKYDNSGNVIGGYTVGHIIDGIAAIGLVAPYNAASVSAGLRTQSEVNAWNAISSGRGKFVFKYVLGASSNQVNPSNPASTGTLTGLQYEWVQSLHANPASTSADNSSYADITFLQVNGDLYPAPNSGSFSTTTEQLSIYYEQGVKVDLYSAGLSSGSYTNAASNQFIDLVMYLFELYKQTSGSSTADISQPVYLTNLQNLCTFTTTYKLYFNGILSQAVNIVEYVSKLAPFFFLSFLSDGGRYRFAPILPLNGSHAIDVTALSATLTFTEANIIPGSFSKTYLSVEDRRDFVATVVYRSSQPTVIGAQRTLSVRYPSTAIDAPTEQYDMSDFATDPDHCILYAKYELARRKYSTHNIAFTTPLLTTALIPTDIIKVTRSRKSSTQDADRTETNWYQVTRLSHKASGETQIEASHFPVNGSSISEISNEVLNGTFTVIQ